MEKIGKLRHELRTENMISSESSTYQIIEVVNALVDAHNELLETHTVKEPDLELVESLAIASKMSVKKQNSEKEEHKHRMEDTPLNSEYCLDCGVVFGKKEEIKEQPTTPETKVKISCPDCPHEETDTPEKKIHCFDCGAQTMKDCEHHKETDAPEKKCHCTCTHEGFCSESHKEKL